MDNVGQLEMYKLEKNMGILSVVSKACTHFWFCGNADWFDAIVFNIQQANEVEINVVSQGIYTKLITSITGLVIGLDGLSVIVI